MLVAAGAPEFERAQRLYLQASARNVSTRLRIRCTKTYQDLIYVKGLVLLASPIKVFSQAQFIVDVYIVSKLANFWGVVNYGVILSRCSTSAEAIRLAVQTAATVAKRTGPAQVLVEDVKGDRRVVWDSTRDGFAAG